MSQKDPAFLFYPKDWIQRTSQMFPDEKGVYIDLLCHQHQDGDLPNDTKRLARIAGLSEADFLRIWEVVGKKFTTNSVNRLVDEWLTGITKDRLTKGLKNTLTGTFASLIRLAKISPEMKEQIKSEFNIEAFLTDSKEISTNRLTDWFNSRLPIGSKSIANANVYVNGNVNREEVKEEGGVGEEEKGEGNFAAGENEKFLSPQMVKIFKKAFPKYAVDREKDFTACLAIAYKIAEQHGWSKGSAVNGKWSSVLQEWQIVVDFIEKDDYYCNLSIEFLNRQWGGLSQKMNKKTGQYGNNKGNFGAKPAAKDVPVGSRGKL